MGFHTWIKRWYRIYGKKKKRLCRTRFYGQKVKLWKPNCLRYIRCFLLLILYLLFLFLFFLFINHQNLFIFVYFSQFFDVYTPSLSWARKFSNSFIWEVHFVYFTVIQFYFILYKSRKKKPYFSLSLPVCLCV